MTSLRQFFYGTIPIVGRVGGRVVVVWAWVESGGWW